MTSELLEANIALSVYNHSVPLGLKVCFSGAVDNIQFDIYRRGNRVFVAFRGTDEVKDCFRHLWVRRKGIGNGALIHRGWHRDWQKVLPIVYAVLREQTTDLATEVTFIGHSYGAALATIAAYFYSPEIGMPRTHLRTYGSPRVGNSIFVQELEKRVNTNYRYVTARDPIPMVPLAIRYTHGGTEIRLPYHKSPHSMKGYLKALDR